MVAFVFRNFETVKLQYRHFDFNCVSDDPQKVPFIKVNLTDRKGWQNRMASSQGGNIQGGNYLKVFSLFFKNSNHPSVSQATSITYTLSQTYRMSMLVRT
jgi:hypothetical protein